MREWYQLMLCIAFSLSFSGLYLLLKAFLRAYREKDTEDWFSTEEQMEQENAIEKKTDRKIAFMIFVAIFLLSGVLVYVIEKTINKGGM